MSNSNSESEDDLPSVSLSAGDGLHGESRGHYRRNQHKQVAATLPSPVIISSSGSSSASRGTTLSNPSSQEFSPLESWDTYHQQQQGKKRSRINKSNDHDIQSTSASVGKAIKRPKVQTSKRELAQQERMERKRQEALEKRKASEARRLDKERKQAEKRHQNEMKKALKKAASDASKESRQPGDRVKQMVVVLDKALVENAEFMTELTPELSALGVGYQVGSAEMHPGSVQWKRMISERTVDEDAKIIEHVIEVDENELLVTLEAQGLIGLVHCTKQIEQGIPLQDGACTLQQFVEDVQQDHLEKRISLAIEGIDSFLRGNKTQFNRNFREAVRNNKSVASKERMFSDVTYVDCMEALASLQLTTNCVARMCVNKLQLAEHIVVMTKALSEAHFRKESPFSFHVEAGQGASRQALRETDNRVSLIWKHQLMQFNNVSESMAAAIVAVHPSPAHLQRAYESCADKKKAELLLQDVLIRRGVGVVASTRRFGPALSKRIHAMMTSKDSQLTLS